MHKNIKLFGFVAGYKAQTIQPQNPVNIKAAERMGRRHDALKASGYSGHPLEVLLVRLLFCLFADDTGIFQPAQAFRAFIEERTAADGSDLGARLGQLFQILNTADGAGSVGNHENKRSKALDEQVAAFPYINGKLFDEPLPMADFNAAMREALLDACALDWSAISPAIFGSLFQSIMDDKARRNLGAHYTSEENILKLIKPLFLDELWAEFNKVKSNKNRLFEFHKKLRTLTFFDPACGCGNFLVISYRELRLLELEVLRASNTAGQQSVDVHQLIGINVDQFYGIEIEEFPAQIAQVALWLMDHQMNLRVSEEFGLYFARIPLRTTPHVVHGNALRLDWNEVLPAERCSFVLGNPPFVGAKFMDDAQRDDTRLVFAGIANAGLLDFVAGWYVKAARYLRGDAPAIAGYPPGAHEPSVFKIEPGGYPTLASSVDVANSARVPQAMKRVQAVNAFRLVSKSPPTQKLALTPTRFHVENIPTKPYLLIPRVSSERRAFVPMGYIDSGTLTSDSAHMATGISIFHFGILSSTMHNAWVRTTCGRLKSDYRYSKDIVYNNFPWPDLPHSSESNQPAAPVHKAQAAIETAAQAVLDARAKFQSGAQPASLADLYDPLTMPPALVKAHQKLDAAVDAAYALGGGKKTWKNDAERVAYLFELYQRYTSLLPTEKAKSKRRAKAE